MTTEQVVTAVHHYIEGLFPKTCSNCGRTFTTLRDFLEITRHTGDPITITSERMAPALMLQLRAWSIEEMARTGLTMRELLRHVRASIDAAVLGEKPANHDRGGTRVSPSR